VSRKTVERRHFGTVMWRGASRRLALKLKRKSNTENRYDCIGFCVQNEFVSSTVAKFLFFSLLLLDQAHSLFYFSLSSSPNSSSFSLSFFTFFTLTRSFTHLKPERVPLYIILYSSPFSSSCLYLVTFLTDRACCYFSQNLFFLLPSPPCWPCLLLLLLLLLL